MSHSDSSDLLPTEGQLDMFGASPTPSAPDIETVRAELADVLAKVRATPRESLAASDTSHFRNIFARMVDALPAEEADRMRLEFETEMARLTAS